MDFLEAQALLGRRDSRKVANNTYLKRLSSDSIGVKLHHTYVLTHYRDGKIKFNSGGWQTPTTKDRINHFQDKVDICSIRGKWYIVPLGRSILPIPIPELADRKKGFRCEKWDYRMCGFRFYDGILWIPGKGLE